MTLFVDLKKLLVMPSSYENSPTYVVTNNQIEALGSFPPRYTIGYKSEIIHEPYINIYGVGIIRLADTPQNHDGIGILSKAFHYDRFLTKANNRPVDAKPITPKEQKEIQVAQAYVAEFCQNFGPVMNVSTDDEPQQLSDKKSKPKNSTKPNPS